MLLQSEIWGNERFFGRKGSKVVSGEWFFLLMASGGKSEQPRGGGAAVV